MLEFHILSSNKPLSKQFADTCLISSFKQIDYMSWVAFILKSSLNLLISGLLTYFSSMKSNQLFNFCASLRFVGAPKSWVVEYCNLLLDKLGSWFYLDSFINILSNLFVLKFVFLMFIADSSKSGIFWPNIFTSVPFLLILLSNYLLNSLNWLKADWLWLFIIFLGLVNVLLVWFKSYWFLLRWSLIVSISIFSSTRFISLVIS